eukprot:1748256-Rhodomonas_salina.1
MEGGRDGNGGRESVSETERESVSTACRHAHMGVASHTWESHHTHGSRTTHSCGSRITHTHHEFPPLLYRIFQRFSGCNRLCSAPPRLGAPSNTLPICHKTCTFTTRPMHQDQSQIAG